MNRQTFWQRLKQMLAPVLVGLVAVGKWILPVLKFGLPILKTGGSMLLVIVIYSYQFGWAFAAGFVLLIFVHELGHLIAARMMGLKVGMPVFIPFMGALIALKEAPRNAWVEAVVGLGGPLLGTLGALGAAGIYYLNGNPLFLVLGYAALFLNLFNMIPIVPLDGGRIVSAVSPWLWVVGLAIIVPYLLWHPSPVTFIILLIVLTSLPRLRALFRQRSPAELRYFECTPVQRVTMALLYFGLLAGIYSMMGVLRHHLHGYMG